MNDLIKRLEKAREGSRELSDECLLAVGWRVERPKDCGMRDQTGDCYGCGSKPPGGDKCAVPRSNWIWINPTRISLSGKRPHVTQNVQDAIDWMVPEGWCGNVDFGVGEAQEAILWNPTSNQETDAQFAPTPTLALCIASLRAIEARALASGGTKK
jgi:hypothetical protein